MKLFSNITAVVKNFQSWTAGIFKDETGNPSSKRVVGVICGISLCVVMFMEKVPAQSVVDAVALLAFGCLGLSSVDKFTSTKKSITDALAGKPSNPCPTCGNDPCTCASVNS